MSIVRELKRRNVFRVAAAYAVVGWVLAEIGGLLFDTFEAPAWVMKVYVSLIVLGFPLAVFLAWAYELTPEGLKREAEVDRSQSITHMTGRRLDFVMIGLLAVAVVYFAWDKFIATPEGEAVQITATPEVSNESNNSIAVLPFVNMSDDPNNEYFSDGLSEELLNALARIGGLKVTGRTSSFAFKDKNTDLREIGRLLNVANVLEGSVRKYENRVRITAQLINTADGYHLWSETFDRELGDIFAIQEEIANHVTSALRVALLGPDKAQTETASSKGQNAQAYDEYLRGMYIYQRNIDDKEGLARAREHFARAVEIDANFVDGYWGMFKTWDRWHRNGHGPYEESAEQIAIYAAKLKQLAPGSEQALTANARSATIHGDPLRASRILEDAVKRYPGSTRILGRYGGQTVILGNYDEGMAALREAIRLDPLSLEYMSNMASVQHRAGDCEGARQTMDRALELDTRAGRVRYHLAMCIFETTGDASQALQIASSEPLGFMHDTALAILQHRLGDPDSAQQQLDDMVANFGDSAAYQYSQVYTQWGDIKKALGWLETALAVRDPGLLLVKTDTLLDPLRDEPRFRQVLESAGFEETVPDP